MCLLSHHTKHVTDIVSFFHGNASEAGRAYVMFDYDTIGMKHIVKRMGTSDDVTVFNVLQPYASDPTRRLMVIACLAKTECGLYLDLDVWLHNHSKWSTYMRGAIVIDCRTGMRMYALSICTVREDTPTVDTNDEPSMWHRKGYLATETQHGTVTTQFMGVTKGDPNWGDLRSDLTRMIIHLIREQGITQGHDTLYFRNRRTYHDHTGLILFTNQLHQIRREGEVAFIEIPSGIGMVFVLSAIGWRQ